MHVGSHALVATCAIEAGIDTETLADLLRRRAFHDPILERLTPQLRQLTEFIGGRADFDALRERIGSVPASVADAADQLVRAVHLLQEILPDEWADRIRIDASELGSYHYYTGIAFSAYIPDSNAAVIRGGRYDRLLQSFGFDAPSVGFSLFTRKLPASVFADDDRNANTVPAKGATLADRVADARRGHSKRKRVHL
jgi:ATP phosphoribosyltransferase regulatory subunit